jgi:hypothetical protein
MAKLALIPSAVGLLLLGLMGLGYYHLMVKQSEAFCGFCHRPIHAHARVIAEVGGRRRTVCCALRHDRGISREETGPSD